MDKFIREDWVFERSSGWAGERNIKTGEWIHEKEFNERKRKQEEDDLWEETVFRVIKLHTKSNSITELIVDELRKTLIIFNKEC